MKYVVTINTTKAPSDGRAQFFWRTWAKTVLRGIRVKSKEELSERLLKYLHEVNEMPVIFRWKYGFDSLSVV